MVYPKRLYSVRFLSITVLVCLLRLSGTPTQATTPSVDNLQRHGGTNQTAWKAPLPDQSTHIKHGAVTVSGVR